MKTKLKKIVAMGFLWGIPFWILMSAIRWMENKPPAFGSLTVFFAICIVAGCLIGLFTATGKYIETVKKPRNFITSYLLIILALIIYLILFKTILLPNNLTGSLFDSALLIFLILSTIIVEKKLIKKL
ncbi:hypothetical protein ACT4WO_20120 (plasmid) [Acinetobacter baumannii]|uniref:hypothetical protein n=1 Tax=Acinetobacter baumannii TaxID=470 RepID=UPI0037C1451B